MSQVLNNVAPREQFPISVNNTIGNLARILSHNLYYLDLTQRSIQVDQELDLTLEFGRRVELLGVGRGVAPVAAVPLQQHLLLQRQLEEPLALGEQRLQQAVLDPVVGDVEEPALHACL